MNIHICVLNLVYIECLPSLSIAVQRLNCSQIDSILKHICVLRFKNKKSFNQLSFDWNILRKSHLTIKKIVSEMGQKQCNSE